MKVERNEDFTPITITIETYEEACNLWHKLNAEYSDIDSDTLNYDYEGLNNDTVDEDMFQEFNKVFIPEET